MDRDRLTDETAWPTECCGQRGKGTGRAGSAAGRADFTAGSGSFGEGGGADRSRQGALLAGFKDGASMAGSFAQRHDTQFIPANQAARDAGTPQSRRRVCIGVPNPDPQQPPRRRPVAGGRATDSDAPHEAAPQEPPPLPRRRRGAAALRPRWCPRICLPSRERVARDTRILSPAPDQS